MYYRDILVLEYKIEYPVFRSTCNQRAVEAINAFYLSLAERKERYCKLVLYPQAAEAARFIQGNDPAFNFFEFDISYTITLNKGCMVSLYMEEYTFMGGAHGSTIRTSETWDFMTGKQIFLKNLYEDELLLRDKVRENIEKQIAERVKTAPESFFDNYKKLVGDTLNLNSFYLTPEGAAIYFQQYDIAPYAAGFPEFPLPFIIIHGL